MNSRPHACPGRPGISQIFRQAVVAAPFLHCLHIQRSFARAGELLPLQMTAARAVAVLAASSSTVARGEVLA